MKHEHPKITRQNVPSLQKLLRATIGLLQLCITEFEKDPTHAALAFGAAYGQMQIVMEAIAYDFEE